MSMNLPIIDGFNTPTPDQVPGFTTAKTAQQLPAVPNTPPKPLPGATANQILVRGLIIFGVAILIAIIFGKTNLFGGAGNILAFVFFAIGFAQMFWGIIRSMNRVIEECKTGYTTSRIISTNSRNPNAPRQWNNGLGNGRARTRMSPWNFDGVWYLKNDGTVRTAANPNVLAPGYYPSPNRQGEFELWTGYCWQGKFRPTV